MTLDELRAQLLGEGFHPDGFALGDDTPHYEGLCLKEEHGVWKIEFFERGSYRHVETHLDEPAACASFLEHMRKDKGAYRIKPS